MSFGKPQRDAAKAGCVTQRSADAITASINGADFVGGVEASRIRRTALQLLRAFYVRGVRSERQPDRSVYARPSLTASSRPWRRGVLDKHTLMKCFAARILDGALHVLFVLLVVLISSRAYAATSLEMVVLVTGPDPGREHVSDVLRADMKERGHVVHDPSRAIALAASLDAAASSLLAGRAPAEVMRERLGIDVVLTVTIDGTEEEGYSLAVLAATSRGIARRTARASGDTLDDVTLRAVLAVVSASASSQSSDSARPVEGAALDMRSGIGLEVGGTFDDAEAKRRAWKERGGGIVSYEVRAQLSGILMPERDLPCVSPKGRLAPTGGAGQGGGGGGGASVRVSCLYMSSPNPETKTDS